MGSMIGSGIFIVSADISRLVDSPVLLIGAWVLTGFLTISGALAYGELAAMMPHAGGQYVYLREAFGRMWGFLYGWTLFMVVQAGTIAAVGIAFGKFLGVFVRSVSSTNWLSPVVHVPLLPFHLYPGGPTIALGNMDVGLNTRNLAAILVVVFLSVLNIFGVRTGAIVQNIFTIAKTAALLGLVLLGLLIGRNAQAIAANFGSQFWRNAGWHSLHPVQVGVGGPIRRWSAFHHHCCRPGGLAVLVRRLEQHHLHGRRGTEPEAKPAPWPWCSVRVQSRFLLLANFVYLSVLPLQGDAHGATILARGVQHRRKIAWQLRWSNRSSDPAAPTSWLPPSWSRPSAATTD